LNFEHLALGHRYFKSLPRKSMKYKTAYKSNITIYNQAQEENSPELIFYNKIQSLAIDEKNDKWFNTKEAAYFLRITPNALRLLVHKAKVKYYKLGYRLRFKYADLLLLLEPQGV